MRKNKVVACIIARTVSTRLPLKILRDIGCGMSMLDFLVHRIKAVKSIDEIYICTSGEAVDDILEDVAHRNGVKLYRGSADQVIERLLSVGQLTNADIILRITGDNPLTSFEYIDAQVEHLRQNNLDYVRIVDVPIGATAEVISMDALVRVNEMMDPDISEYMMLFLFEPNHFKCGVIKAFEQDYSEYSVTVDTPEDLKRTRKLLSALNPKRPEDILLEHVINGYENNGLDIEAKKIIPSGHIKLPYGKTMAYDDFREDMKRRVRQSQIFVVYEQ